MFKAMLILWLASTVLAVITKVVVNGMDATERFVAKVADVFPVRVSIVCWLALLTWIATIVVTVITIIKL